jgi:hypothetical protein
LQLSYFGTRSGERLSQALTSVLVHRLVAQVSWHF